MREYTTGQIIGIATAGYILEVEVTGPTISGMTPLRIVKTGREICIDLGNHEIHRKGWTKGAQERKWLRENFTAETRKRKACKWTLALNPEWQNLQLIQWTLNRCLAIKARLHRLHRQWSQQRAKLPSRKTPQLPRPAIERPEAINQSALRCPHPSTFRIRTAGRSFMRIQIQETATPWKAGYA